MAIAKAMGGRLALAVVLLLAASCGGEAKAPPSNLLLVLLDTTRADHLSCYGHPALTTPTLDALARTGTRFDAAYAQSSLTPVSAGTLLSGALPFRHGVRSLFVVGEQRMAADVASLGELLAASGRRTVGFVSAKPMGRQYGLDRGFELWHDDLTDTAARHGIRRFADAPQRPAEETADLALAWLDAHGREPFALLLHLFDAHDPSFLPPREFLQERVSFPLPEGLGRTSDARRFPELYTPERLVEIYDAELAWMDAQVNRVVHRLEQLGALRDTLIVVVADHGEAFGEHGFWSHGLLYQEQLRVPLIVKGPHLPSGRLVGDRVRLVDLLPTLAELLALPRPAQALDGASFAPLLAMPRRAPPEERDVYAEVHHADQDRLQREREMYSLAAGRWKLIHRPVSGAHELYDLAADPLELTNLYAPEHPMARLLGGRLAAMGAVSGTGASLEGIPPEELERLRELGYL